MISVKGVCDIHLGGSPSESISVEASLTNNEAQLLNKKSKSLQKVSGEVGAITVAALILMKFNCREYLFADKTPGILGAINDFKNSITNFKKISFNKQDEKIVEMIIDQSIFSIFNTKSIEISLCESDSSNYKCVATKSEYISYLRYTVEKERYLLIIERTLPNKSEFNKYPFSASDGQRRLNSLIVCSESL